MEAVLQFRYFLENLYFRLTNFQKMARKKAELMTLCSEEVRVL